MSDIRGNGKREKLKEPGNRREVSMEFQGSLLEISWCFKI